MYVVIDQITIAASRSRPKSSSTAKPAVGVASPNMMLSGSGDASARRAMIDNLRCIVGATDLPVTVDLESGYGDAPEVVGETLALAPASV
jgi:2-methylisocitrate lyase-like PEP mutase family enzyme